MRVIRRSQVRFRDERCSVQIQARALFSVEGGRRGQPAGLQALPEIREGSRQRRDDAQGLAADRMTEGEGVGVQGLAVEFGAGRAIDPVADQRVTVVGGVDADLVLAAGVEVDVQQRGVGR